MDNNITLRAESKVLKSRQEVPFQEFEALLSQLRQATNSTQSEAMETIGYASNSAVSSWRDKNKAPAVGLYALKWVLHQLQIAPAQALPKAPSFSFEELADLFAALRGLPLNPTSQKALLRKVASALSQL